MDRIAIVQWIFYFITVIGIILFFSLISSLSQYLRTLSEKNKNDMKNSTLLLKGSINLEDLQTELNLFISSTFEEIVVLNPKYQQDYTPQKLETDLGNDLADAIQQRISDTYLAQLSLFYNNEAISNMIANMIYLVVMNHTIKINQIDS